MSCLLILKYSRFSNGGGWRVTAENFHSWILSSSLSYTIYTSPLLKRAQFDCHILWMQICMLNGSLNTYPTILFCLGRLGHICLCLILCLSELHFISSPPSFIPRGPCPKRLTLVNIQMDDALVCSVLYLSNPFPSIFFCHLWRILGLFSAMNKARRVMSTTKVDPATVEITSPCTLLFILLHAVVLFRSYTRPVPFVENVLKFTLSLHLLTNPHVQMYLWTGCCSHPSENSIYVTK